MGCSIFMLKFNKGDCHYEMLTEISLGKADALASS